MYNEKFDGKGVAVLREPQLIQQIRYVGFLTYTYDCSLKTIPMRIEQESGKTLFLLVEGRGASVLAPQPILRCYMHM